MKQFLLTIILLIGLVWLNVKVYAHEGLPYTHDGENHAARFANYKIAVLEGQIPPRWAPNLVNHYGYPVFNYNYPLANILSLPFSALNVSYQLTFKLLMTISVAGGLVGIWVLARSWRAGSGATWLAMSLYGISPYLINALIFRGTIGEVMAFGLLPWLLWVIEVAKKPLSKPLAVVGIGLFTAFFLVHNVAVLMTAPLLLGFAVITFGRDGNAWRRLGIVSGLAVLLSLWFWLPALAEKSLVVLDNATLSRSFLDHFPTLQQLFFGPISFGFSYPGSIDSLSFNLGLAQVFIWMLSGIWILKNRNRLKNHLFPFLGFLVATALILFQLSITSSLWSIVPTLRFIQLPWRLGLVWLIVIPVLSLWLYDVWPSWVRKLLVVLLLFQAIYIYRVTAVDYRNVSDLEYDNFVQSTTTGNENLPLTFTYEHISDWQPSPVIIQGDGEIEVSRWQGSRRKYQLRLTEPSTIAEPTMLFAGWQTWVIPEGAKNYQVEYVLTEDSKGRIAYQLPAGNYQIHTHFTQWTWPRMIGNGVSLVAAVGLAAWLVSRKYDKI